METTNESTIFSCPGCNNNFEFDPVGENEFVPCPICGTEFMTVRKGQQLLLKSFETELRAPEEIMR